MQRHILVVEDEEKISSLLKDYLENSNFSVSCFNRGDYVIPEVKKNPPDLILLDVMLPGMDGIDVCRELRKFSRIPVIMVTARVEEIDRLIGLEIGADDYICKPFSPREVVARVKTVLRRVYPEADMDLVKAGPVCLNKDTRHVTIHGKELVLTPNEFELLKAFMKYPEKVFSRNDLVNKVQGYDYEGYDRTIDTHIKNLRKKISHALPDEHVIQTVYGVGYKLSIK